MIRLIHGPLYLGNRAGAKNLSLLQSEGITAIVQIGGTKKPHPGITYHYINLPDSVTAEITPDLTSTRDFVAQEMKRGKVLIHCSGGLSRSPALLIACLASLCSLSLEEAYALVQAKRPEIKPRPNFPDEIRLWLQLQS